MTTEEKIKDIIEDAFGLQNVVNSDKFSEWGLDSLDQIDLVMKLEEEFKIEIPDDAAEKFNTVQDIVDYIDKGR